MPSTFPLYVAQAMPVPMPAHFTYCEGMVNNLPAIPPGQFGLPNGLPALTWHPHPTPEWLWYVMSTTQGQSAQVLRDYWRVYTGPIFLDREDVITEDSVSTNGDKVRAALPTLRELYVALNKAFPKGRIFVFNPDGPTPNPANYGSTGAVYDAMVDKGIELGTLAANWSGISAICVNCYLVSPALTAYQMTDYFARVAKGFRNTLKRLWSSSSRRPALYATIARNYDVAGALIPGGIRDPYLALIRQLYDGFVWFNGTGGQPVEDAAFAAACATAAGY